MGQNCEPILPIAEAVLPQGKIGYQDVGLSLKGQHLVKSR